MTIHQALQFTQKRLAPVAGDFALPEAERILTFLLNCSRSALYISQKKELPSGTTERIQTIIKRRLKDEPVAFILGSVYFYNREFIVSPDVLIPRPDTEILAEEVFANEPPAACRFLDVGTGSGCIAAVLTERNPLWKAFTTDLSFSALKIAKKNCQKVSAILCCDRLAAIKNDNHALFDFIVSNPPYIKSSVLPALEKSVRAFEPLRALDGGKDGLDFFRYFATTAPPLLRDGGRIYCEIGYDQGDAVPDIFSSAGWNGISVTKDTGNRPRVLRAINP